MVPRVRGVFYVFDFDCEAADITSAIGTAPTRTWLAGERIGRSTRLEKSNGWCLETGTDDSDPEVHLKWLFSHLPPSLGSLLAVASHWTAQVSLVVEMADQTPSFNLSQETIRKLNALGARLDVDMYIVEDDTRGVGRE